MTKTFKQLYKFHLLVLVLIILSGCCFESPVEIPAGFSPAPKTGFDLQLDHTGFSLGYSYRHRQSLWASYELTAEQLNQPQHTRKDRFAADPLVRKNPVQPKEYTKTGFDRGHLAPAADLSYSKAALADSFYMSNMSPQRPDCNRNLWLKLEKQVRSWAKNKQRIWVVTGPLFCEPSPKMGKTDIPVPAAFYKVLLAPGYPAEMIGFIVPNSGSDRPLKSFACPVDDVEKASGLDFFSDLADPVENQLESQVVLRGWFGDLIN